MLKKWNITVLLSLELKNPLCSQRSEILDYLKERNLKEVDQETRKLIQKKPEA
jgi:hypothetical protein